MLQNEHQIRALESAGLGDPVGCWLKLDSGMHRLGFPVQQARALVERLTAISTVAPQIVLATHLACADDLENAFTRQQIKLFREHTDGLHLPCSLANSPGLLGWPETRAEWNRPGVMLYGPSPFPAPHPEADRLRPVMTLKSAVIALRDLQPGDSVGYGGAWTASRPSRIATIPVGYGDGYPRRAESGTPVLVRGHRVPLAGRVSMDMITVDVTDIPDVAVGDEVILWGKEILVNEVAAHADTIGYEIMTRLLARVPRKYME
jgi:alanine racemase